MSEREQRISEAIEEWAAIAGGPDVRRPNEPTLAHYIDVSLRQWEAGKKCAVCGGWMIDNDVESPTFGQPCPHCAPKDGTPPAAPSTGSPT